ncbi:MAG: YeeE/YedE family protein [Rhodobacteraceae bacterium]|nr:YeeE/YedE family protein [Paracoccaceae bacterium]
MDIASLMDWLGDSNTKGLAGLLVGVVFGVAAQRSRFCLRASAVEFARGKIGPRTSVWLLTFATALFWTQGAMFFDIVNLDEARILAIPGSISGAVIGGLIFGVGMVLARGCSGRLLVLAATGNLRAVISGLVFAVFAQMSLYGWLSPVREALAGIWTTPNGRNINVLEAAGLPDGFGMLMGILFAIYAIYIAYKNKVGAKVLFFASGVGFAVALGWYTTFSLSSVSFEPTSIESLTFTGPSANTLMYVLESNAVLSFSIGLIPGVFLGAFVAAFFARELKLQGFEGGASMRRYLTGAAMMGFGGMLAGGCAIGNGVTGTSVFSLTAWIALTFFWIGAKIADTLFDNRTVRFATA